MNTDAGNFKLECWSCQRTVTTPPTDGTHACPLCGAALDIRWRAEAAEGSPTGGWSPSEDAPSHPVCP
jgi:rRNA maturation endonuclease Nob1